MVHLRWCRDAPLWMIRIPINHSQQLHPESLGMGRHVEGISALIFTITQDIHKTASGGWQAWCKLMYYGPTTNDRHFPLAWSGVDPNFHFLLLPF